MKVGMGEINLMDSVLHTEPQLSGMWKRGRRALLLRPHLLAVTLLPITPQREGSFPPSVWHWAIGDAQLDMKGNLFMKGEPGLRVCVCVYSLWLREILARLFPRQAVTQGVWC